MFNIYSLNAIFLFNIVAITANTDIFYDDNDIRFNNNYSEYSFLRLTLWITPLIALIKDAGKFY